MSQETPACITVKSGWPFIETLPWRGCVVELAARFIERLPVPDEAVPGNVTHVSAVAAFQMQDGAEAVKRICVGPPADDADRLAEARE